MIQSFSLAVNVKPFAKTSLVAGMIDGVLQVSLAAKPKDGEANEELIRVLSDALDVPKSLITIQSGHRSRTKVVRFTESNPEIILEKLVGVIQSDKREDSLEASTVSVSCFQTLGASER